MTSVTGECFGVLGLDGSGKTTFFKMLTCDQSISRGEYYFQGLNSAENIKTVGWIMRRYNRIS